MHGARNVYVNLLWEETWIGGLAGRGVSAGELGAGCTVSKLGSKCWHCAGSQRCWCVYAGGEAWKWHSPAILFLEKSLKDPGSPVHNEICINISPSHIPEALFNLLFLCSISMGLFVVLSL